MNLLLLGLMALIDTNSGEVLQFGHVDSFPAKPVGSIERAITDAELRQLVQWGGSAKLEGGSFVQASVTLPQAFPLGVAVPDEEGHYYEVVPYAGRFIAAQVSDSPLTSAVRRASGVAAAKAADNALRADVLAIRTNLAAVIDQTTGALARVQAINTDTSTAAAQAKQIADLQRELIKALRIQLDALQLQQDQRGVLRNIVKGQ